MAKRTLIVDLDGTLADVGHRIHHIRNVKRKNWPAFFEAMPADPLNVWCRDLICAMKAQGFSIAIVSGRPDEYADAIKEWLRRHEVPYDALHLRATGDYRPDTTVKREILHRDLDKNDVLFAVDDREPVVAMWREEGIVCLQCDPHA